MTEKQFKKTLCKKLRDDGYIVFDCDVMAGMYPGYPDIFIFKNNKTMHAELKIEDGIYTKAQRVFYSKYHLLPIAHFRYMNKDTYESILTELRKVFR
jgi:hypothetical protein